MIQLQEGKLTFSFEGVDAVQYDNWAFYRRQFNNACGGCKAVDFICQDKHTTWLIEVKDYRVDRRTKLIDLAEEVAIKVRDTLAGLVAAQSNANSDTEKNFASHAVQNNLRVVLHLEQPRKTTRLFPQVADPAQLKMALKQKIKCIDAHPEICNRTQMKSSMPWTVKG
jgi:hypothetical protein